jgi:hypothetical protein
MDFSKIHETELQKYVHRLISDPSVIRETVSGKRLQILSPGEFNVHGGPDFLDAAILIGGLVNVGDIEFHRNASEWLSHGHSENSEFDNVILHIVMNNDRDLGINAMETLVVSEDELNVIASEKSETVTHPENFNLEDLQHFALVRLLRKSSEIQKLLNKNNLLDTLQTVVQAYISKYNSRRKRPVYTDKDFDEVLTNLYHSKIYEFLENIKNSNPISIPDMMLQLMRTKIAGEGAHLRREILLNCVLPIALCLADDEARINLFLWYWSTPALHTYGVLTRKFKGMPQNFLWEQQGMLEYMKEYGRRPYVVRDAVESYGFAGVLSFYRLGRAPFKDTGK